MINENLKGSNTKGAAAVACTDLVRHLHRDSSCTFIKPALRANSSRASERTDLEYKSFGHVATKKPLSSSFSNP